MTTSRSQPAETRSNRSNCRIRSNSSGHREVARDVKEIVALHCSRRRTSPLHNKSSQSTMKCDDGIHENLHDGVMSFNDTDALQGIGERMMKDQNAV